MPSQKNNILKVSFLQISPTRLSGERQEMCHQHHHHHQAQHVAAISCCSCSPGRGAGGAAAAISCCSCPLGRGGAGGPAAAAPYRPSPVFSPSSFQDFSPGGGEVKKKQQRRDGWDISYMKENLTYGRQSLKSLRLKNDFTCLWNWNYCL
jgi:hypothetical protein